MSCPTCGADSDGRYCSRAFCGARGEQRPENYCRACEGSGRKLIYAGNGGVSEVERCVMCAGTGVTATSREEGL